MVSDAVFISIITTGTAFLGTVFTGIMSYLLVILQRTSDKIHVLVNSNMGIQLRLTALALDRIASLSRDPADLLAAQEAKDLYKDHTEKQQVVNSLPT